MKKRSYYVILFGLTALLLSSCGKNATGGAESSEAGTEAAGEEKNTGTEGSEETMQEEKDAAGGESEDGTASGGCSGTKRGGRSAEGTCMTGGRFEGVRTVRTLL